MACSDLMIRWKLLVISAPAPPTESWHRSLVFRYFRIAISPRFPCAIFLMLMESPLEEFLQSSASMLGHDQELRTLNPGSNSGVPRDGSNGFSISPHGSDKDTSPDGVILANAYLEIMAGQWEIKRKTFHQNLGGLSEITEASR